MPTDAENVYLVPATMQLAGAEIELVSAMARENILKGCISEIKGEFDFIFIDCPPSLGLLTVNALVAADSLIIPIQCEYYALEGVSKLVESMRMVKRRLNPDLDIFGVLLTMFDTRTTLSRQVADEVCGYFKDDVFKTIIPRSVKVSEAPSHGVPVVKPADSPAVYCIGVRPLSRERAPMIFIVSSSDWPEARRMSW